jgi:hypothetical protein
MQWIRLLAMSSATKVSDTSLEHVSTPRCIASETRISADAGSRPRLFNDILFT